jgi:hypothetical protein
LHTRHALEQIVARVQLHAQELAQTLDHARMVLRMRIQTSACRRAADAKPLQAFGSHHNLLDVALDGLGVAAEFLSHADWHSVLQVRASALDDVIELDRFLAQHILQFAQRLHQLVQAPQRADSDGGRDGVVRALRHVNVIVGADRLIFGRRAERIAENLVGARRDHFVRVHVVAGASACLERIDHELVVQLACHDLSRR